MGNKVAGIVFIKADGIQFDVTGGVEIPLSSVVREEVPSLTNEGGHFKETGVAPYVKLSAIAEADLDYNTLTTATDLTITVELANNKVYVLTEAYVEGEVVIKADDGTFDITFKGAKGVWS